MPTTVITPSTTSSHSPVLARIGPNARVLHQAAERHVDVLHHAHAPSADHCRRVSTLARALAQAAGYNQSTSDHVALVALLHDIGKAHIDPTILDTPRRLTEEERQVMDRHAHLGQVMLQDDPWLKHCAEPVGQHHDRWDASGEAMPLASRITAVVDAWDAMTQPRPYAPAMDPRDARAELARCAGTQFDPDLTGVFLAGPAHRIWARTA